MIFRIDGDRRDALPVNPSGNANGYFISYTEAHFRTTGPAGDLVVAVAVAWIAGQERKRISDRTRAGMETARRRGIVLGRPAKEIDSAQVLRLHAAGNGVLEIAKHLTAAGSPVSRETIRRIVLNKESRTPK